MKFSINHHVNNVKDRMQGPLFQRLSRMVTVGLAMVLIAIPAFVPSIIILTAGYDGSVPQTSIRETPHTAPSLNDSPTLVLTDEMLSHYEKDNHVLADMTESEGADDRVPENIDHSEHLGYVEGNHPTYSPQVAVTQEYIASEIESSINTRARAGSKIYYPYPAGAMAVDLYKDGVKILKGQVADIGGTVYVPVQRFADLFGNFRTVYTESIEQVVITGTNLSITVKVGDPYITVNERVFYTGKKVISLGGWIFVPLTSMCKALNAKVTIRSGYYDAFITSGDPTKVANASDYYDSGELYWLSRIISAEAKGEPFAGQIAVGNVVLNRKRSEQFPDTVKGVIFDTKYGTQFSPVASGTIYNTPTASSVRAAKICLEGYTLSNKIIYFYNPSIATSSWIGRTRPYIMTIGNHKFYG